MEGDDDEPSTMIYLPEDRQNMSPTDVITTVLEAMQTNDQPRPNHGIQLLLSFMSDASSFGAVSEGGARGGEGRGGLLSFMSDASSFGAVSDPNPQPSPNPEP